MKDNLIAFGLSGGIILFACGIVYMIFWLGHDYDARAEAWRKRNCTAYMTEGVYKETKYSPELGCLFKDGDRWRRL